MSGKGLGKKRNRAAQSEQHGFQEIPDEVAHRPAVGEAGGAEIKGAGEKERIIEKLRDLEKRRSEREGREKDQT